MGLNKITISNEGKNKKYNKKSNYNLFRSLIFNKIQQQNPSPSTQQNYKNIKDHNNL